ncbi:MAG: LysR substrate-binding domain-containing protein [Burkholderiaceae bacterium]
MKPMRIQASELPFFVALAANSSLSAAARDLGITTAAVSRRLSQMETRLGLALISRNTRRMSLTPEGEILLEHARRILDDIEVLDETLSRAREGPQGLLRINATLGFGRTHVAPIVSDFAARHREVDVQLQLSAHPPPFTGDTFDVCIRFGTPPEARVIAKRLAANRRLVCASPRYLAQAGVPLTPKDLVDHRCIGIRQGNDAYGVWRFANARASRRNWTAIKVRGPLTTNDGEIAVNWALAGHGIVLRAEWDVRRYLRSGRLVEVLPGYVTPDADVYAVYAERHKKTVRVKAFVDFAAAAFAALPAVS